MSQFKSVLQFSRTAVLISALWITTAAAQPAAAETPVRPGMQLVGETIADRPSTVYRYETHKFDSVDGKRHYRIQIAIPKAAGPKGGSPVLYMLDGNAAMATLTDDDLKRLDGHAAPVLVAVGYDVPTRNDVVARAYDYTPPVFENGKQMPNPVVRGQEGGGADIFMEFIRTQVKPLVRQAAVIDPAKEYLWGHSYGGLFALHVLYTQPNAFARYIVGDPSAWWNDGALVREWQQFRPDRAAGKRVAVLVGTKPREAGRPTPNPAPSSANSQAIDLRAAVRDMVDGLREAGADATYEAFPQFGHGDMIRASLERALDVASKP